MSKNAKMLERMRHHSHDWRINDLLVIARQYGIAVRHNGGSHYVFEYPGIEEDICVPAHRPVKPVYVRHFIALVTRIEELSHDE